MQATLIMVIAFLLPVPIEPLVLYIPMPTMEACEAWRADPSAVEYNAPIPMALRGTKCVPRQSERPA